MGVSGAVDRLDFFLGIPGSTTLFGISVLGSNAATVMDDMDASFEITDTTAWKGHSISHLAKILAVTVSKATKLWDICNLHEEPSEPLRHGKA